MGSSVPRFAHNHTIDPETGFLENPAYLNDFNAEKKQMFLKVFYENGLRIRRTCDQMGISVDTVNRHYQRDQVFKDLYDEVEAKYIDELEGISRLNALNPRSVIERIFQLKCLKPEKYGQENRPVNQTINITVDSTLLQEAINRGKFLDAEIVESEGKESTGLISQDKANKTT